MGFGHGLVLSWSRDSSGFSPREDIVSQACLLCNCVLDAIWLCLGYCVSCLHVNTLS